MGICVVGGIHRRIDVRCYPEHQEAAALLHFTGSGQFNRFMSRAANHRGYTLSELGLRPSRKKGPAERTPTDTYVPGLLTERQIFEKLELEYKEPWERKDKLDVIDARTGRPFFVKQAGRAVEHLQLGGPAGGAPALL